MQLKQPQSVFIENLVANRMVTPTPLINTPQHQYTTHINTPQHQYRLEPTK
jgi:hypothetical protein